MNNSRFGYQCFCFCAIAASSAARADIDACLLLTSSQVSSAVATSVSGGQHVTETFIKTCTWTASAAGIRAVTLNIQTAAAFDGGKRVAQQAAVLSRGAAAPSAGVGEDSFYFVSGDQVSLFVKKGGSSFKVAVYATLPVDKKKSMELALARQVLAKL